ncbi:MAG: hypothetical protein M1840_008693 [Geoglossum simile]|nr:MAG: hypothetical protein M1840_008693 [Geoglossum simile]
MENADGGERSLSLEDLSRTTQLMFAANSFLSQGQHIEALEIYTEILTLHYSEHPHALLNRSLAYIALSYPELAVADAFRAAVLATHIGEEGWPPHEDIQEYLDIIYTAKKRGLPWAIGLMSQLDGQGMDVSPCSISLEICPDDRDMVSCYGFWDEVECKAKYRLALALWKCGDGAMADALNIIDSYLGVCPTDKAWSRDFRELGDMIMVDVAELIHKEDTLKESLLNSGVLNRSLDGGDMFDMRGIRGLMRAGITMVKREVYPWNTWGRRAHRSIDHLNKVLVAYAPKCRAVITNEGEPGAAKVPTFRLCAGQDILPGQQVLQEPSVLQVAARATHSNSRFFCDACATPLPKTTPRSATESTINSSTGEYPTGAAQGNENASARSRPMSTRTNELDSKTTSGTATPLTPPYVENDNKGVEAASPGASLPTPDYAKQDSEAPGIQVPLTTVSAPFTNDGKHLGRGLASVLHHHVPIRSSEEPGSGVPPEIPPLLARDKVEGGQVSTALHIKQDDVFSKIASPPKDGPDTQHSGDASAPLIDLQRPTQEPSNGGLPSDVPGSTLADGVERGGSSRANLCPLSAILNEDRLADVEETPVDPWCFPSSERTPTPEFDERPQAGSILCEHCRKAYFCSEECFFFALDEYHRFEGNQGLNRHIRTEAVDEERNPYTIPDLIPSAHARIYELLLARIFAMAIERGEHPLELDEVRFLSGGFFAAPRFASAFDSADSDDAYACDDEGPDHTRRRKTLPWSYNANIIRPFNILNKMGIGFFHNLEWFDAWVINTLMAKIMTSTRFTKGEMDGVVIGSIHPLLSLASEGTSQWNCEIDGVEEGLYRNVIASRCPDPNTKDTILSPTPSRGGGLEGVGSSVAISIREGEEARLRTVSFQRGSDASRGKSSNIEEWVQELRTQAS